MSSTTLTAELRYAVKAYLKQDWSDDDAVIDGYIARGMARLNDIAGAQLSYEEEGLPRALLLDYCRYANSHALEVFEKNFAEELAALHYDHLMPALAAQEEGSDED